MKSFAIVTRGLTSEYLPRSNSTYTGMRSNLSLDDLALAEARRGLI